MSANGSAASLQRSAAMRKALSEPPSKRIKITTYREDGSVISRYSTSAKSIIKKLRKKAVLTRRPPRRLSLGRFARRPVAARWRRARRQRTARKAARAPASGESGPPDPPAHHRRAHEAQS
jgi:hypothetical protein